MKADALSLSEVLNNSAVDYYTIPTFQRPYTWEEDDFETLWEDLTDAYLDYTEAVKEKQVIEYYFMGPVVFVKNKGSRSFDIIDGQQRTTTFHILLWYLLRKVTDETEKLRLMAILLFQNKEPKLKVSPKDAATFLSIRESDREITDNSKMGKAANFFKIKLSSLASPDNFSAFLREYIQLIMIVADDYGKAFDLFIGLNGKGVPLNPTDLVKAFVCGRSEGADAGAVWEERMLPLGGDSTACLLFLTRYKAQKFVPENNLFKEITKLYPATITLSDISRNAQLFHLFWRKAIEEIPGEFADGLSFSLEAKKSLRILRDIGRRDFTSLLMKYADDFGLKSIFAEEFLKPLASYQLRMAMTSKRSRERAFVNKFKDAQFKSEVQEGRTRTPDEIIADDKAKALETIKTYLRSDAPNDVLFEALVKVAQYNSNPCRIISKHYEEGKRGNKTILGFELEHLMPQTGTDFWYTEAQAVLPDNTKDVNGYRGLVNNIGNLFVIDSQTNNEIKNYDYPVKKAHYQKHLSGWSIATVTATRSAWIKDDIEQRAQEIAAWANKYWSI